MSEPTKAQRDSWKKRNPEKVKSLRRRYMRRWRARNPEEAKRRDKARYPAEREQRIKTAKAYWRTPKGRAGQICNKAKKRAERKDLEYNITKEYVLEKMEAGHCEVTGLPFVLGFKRGPYSPSLDRIDSTIGYTEDNTRLVIWAINVGCSDWGLEEAKLIWGLVK